jgi:hypothetical protein
MTSEFWRLNPDGFALFDAHDAPSNHLCLTAIKTTHSSIAKLMPHLLRFRITDVTYKRVSKLSGDSERVR